MNRRWEITERETPCGGPMGEERVIAHNIWEKEDARRLMGIYFNSLACRVLPPSRILTGHAQITLIDAHACKVVVVRIRRQRAAEAA